MKNISIIALPFPGNRIEDPLIEGQFDPYIVQRYESKIYDFVEKCRAESQEEIFINFNACNVNNACIDEIGLIANRLNVGLRCWSIAGIEDFSDYDRIGGVLNMRYCSDELIDIGERDGHKGDLAYWTEKEKNLIQFMIEKSDSIIWIIDDPEEQYERTHDIDMQTISCKLRYPSYLVDTDNIELRTFVMTPIGGYFTFPENEFELN